MYPTTDFLTQIIRNRANKSISISIAAAAAAATITNDY